MAAGTTETVLGAIDVGTNAVRLELARPLPDGTLETLHQERDPVRPGEGLFTTGMIPREVADRLLSTLRRYGALSRRFKARVRAVATSAVREAKNRDEVVRRARDEAGLELEVVSGREEARLICLGVLQGRPARERSLLVDIGGGSTEIATATGEKPNALWSVAIGAVRLTEIFEANGKIGTKKIDLMRSFAEEAFREALPKRLPLRPKNALGSSGTIQTVVRFAAAAGTGHATAAQLTRAVNRLAGMSLAERRQHFDPKRAEIVVGGAVVLEAVVRHLGIASMTAVDRGLRDGILVDLLRRARPALDDHSLSDAAVALGRRFQFDEPHALQVRKLALALFDQLARLHALPAATRPLLETAALLHDIGGAVSYQRHHKHTEYLVRNADIPGLTDRERGLVALIARYHRRSAPERTHPGLATLPPGEFQIVRKLSTLLRLADSFDRSHHQPVKSVKAALSRDGVQLRLGARAPLDLEIWDAERELPLFRRIFGHGLELQTGR